MSTKTWITGSFDRNTIATLLFIAVVLIVTFAAYRPGLSGPLFFDDLPQLQPIIDQSADDPGTLLTNYQYSGSGPFGRPVAMTTFVGSAIAHGPDTWWWKYDNLMLHLACGLLVFWCSALLFGQVARARNAKPWMAGAIVAAFWMLHPLQVSTVLFTVQRMTELAAMFALAGMIAYIKGRQRLVGGDPKGWLPIGLAFVGFFPLSVLSKESALLFPAFCGLLELTLFRFEASDSDRKRLKALHGAIAGFFLLGAAYVLTHFSERVLEAYAVRDFGLMERIYTEFRVMVLYLSQLVLPAQGKMGFFHDGIQHSTGLFRPFTTILSALLLAGLAALAVWLRKRLPLFAFGVAFFFIAHALESTIFALELMFEHRNYLPSYGIVLAIAAVAQVAIARRREVLAVVAVGLVAVSFLTWQRSLTWSSPETMYPFMYRVHPESPRLNLAFANFQTQSRNYEQARLSLARIKGSLGPAIHGLFLDCLQHGNVREQDIRELAARPGGWVAGHVTSSVELLVRRHRERLCTLPIPATLDLVDHLLTLPVRRSLDRRSLYLSKARLLELQSDVPAAVAAYESVYELRPDNALGLYLAANTLSTDGQLDKAAELLTAAYAVERAGGFQNKRLARTMYLNLGSIYVAENEFGKALALYTEGTASVPQEILIYLKKVEVLIKLGRYDDARQVLDNRRMLDAAKAGEHARTIKRLRDFLAVTEE